jgi:pimeloyl-[acyl-carrier protein] methyl ester esterase
MDGTGTLFSQFVALLPGGIDVTIVSYPVDRYLSYPQLADGIMRVLPPATPYMIIAESYSGPVASILASRGDENLQAVVFVASFVALPCGRASHWIAKMIPTFLFRHRAPAWLLRWLVMDSATSAETTSAARDAIARVSAEVLTQRLRDSLNVDSVEVLKRCAARLVCLCPGSDRLLGTRGLRGFLAVRPDIQIIKIPGPHFLLQCAPECVLAALLETGILHVSIPGQSKSVVSCTCI